ncbi:MAG: anthranilate synthase component I family protein, partial [Candidatus Hodarchaeota archaeon]
NSGFFLQQNQDNLHKNFQFNDLDYEISQADYTKNIAYIKEKIRNGETFQTVYSQRLSTSYSGDPYEVYLRLREINPSPYLFFIDIGGYQVFGSSPETLISVHQNIVRTFPIAGTRRLGTPEEREFLKQELLNDPKEQAEHNMLVDLGRNDLGKVCKFGTVHVPRYMEPQEFSHVIHLVSVVEGQLRDDKDLIDAFRAVFPAGTVSGAPKIRSMEIIDELEKMRRGPYAGAVGYLSFNARMDLAIAIRTFYTVKNRLYLQAGGGIVIDSNPIREYEETKHKLQALLTALDQTKTKEAIT